jgi:extracellular factor (EF) 3-hydroxypalmitic acid methyl ester biosynthesis protein
MLWSGMSPPGLRPHGPHCGGDVSGHSRGSMQTTYYIPDSYYEGVASMDDWLGSLERSAAIQRPPSAQDAKTLVSFFEKLWVAAGMDASLGLARTPPDQRLFRAKLGRHFEQSVLLKRCLEKPRGYAGDYLMMEGICGRPEDAKTPMGKWLDAWFHDHFPPFVAVRNRRNIVADILSDEYRRGGLRLLNVACGSAPELALLGERARFSDVLLLDQDSEALKLAESRLSGDPASTTVRTVCASIRQLTVSSECLGAAQFDVIYSMGLYDYLSNSQARKLTAALWKVVAPGGLLMIGNFQGHHWARHVMEAVMDWFLIYRDEEHMRSLGEQLPGGSVNVVQDSTGLLHLLQVRKS